jgi:hypothetical protein
LLRRSKLCKVLVGCQNLLLLLLRKETGGGHA